MRFVYRDTPYIGPAIAIDTILYGYTRTLSWSLHVLLTQLYSHLIIRRPRILDPNQTLDAV